MTIYTKIITFENEEHFLVKFPLLNQKDKDIILKEESLIIQLAEKNYLKAAKLLFKEGFNVNSYYDKDYKITNFMALMDCYEIYLPFN